MQYRCWRRKAGVVALGLALMVMAAWLRSLIVIDMYSTAGQKSECLVSGLNIIAWWSNDFGRGTDHGVRAVGGWSTISAIHWKNGLHPHDLETIQWRFRGLGFGYGEVTRPDYIMIYRYLPYWSIALPLTLLSAYLLLVPSRKRPPKPSQPHA